ncbi:M48 family metalloprotease [Phaeobacter gallaeciensis]|uniref:Peptidase M48-like protein n=1 Tax=Phaeobacter gallaeciensis TaxID=60890 RepID=A0AAC9Z7I4_9RHOB|nr:M48 family metalloprotease [Phaeobacter gallaeciensis]AHD08724.1 Peptidase family M48 [Phaeobacter gallaeciensis DSM 26640]ATE91990.1 peptidase M48-like protein [Phaeobacter gallaeciensis]ATE98186.1 peptidase M48-like protein [Phaeobacter gallaeciensis]ATF00606.1 peptidase M48-like protein [Phaeobacter gallaeciensis]ATF05037.1 peptidase M48-like protein [Phaeobacter gallaeciensis]
MRRVLLMMGCALTMGLAACDTVVDSGSAPAARPSGPPVQGMSPAEGRSAFASVTRVVEPVAERECRVRTQGLNCDFLIRIDPNPKAPPNAYQSQDRSGRPVITFTQRMLGQIANRDELAFVMSHEAAHHIRGHLARKRQSAVAGSILLAGLASVSGASAADVARAQDLGAAVGARTYSKNFELEADELGTIITHKAGYRPSVGVKFFYRLPDPGDRFLGSHPANPDRVRVVNQTIQKYNLN